VRLRRGRAEHLVERRISFAAGFAFRVVALYRGWEEPLAKEPAGV